MRLSTRDYITKRLSESERYAQLAEECNELGKAALKIRRVITVFNWKSYEEMNIRHSFAD